MISLKTGLLVIGILFLSSCDYGEEHLVDDFEISWVDSEDFRTLRYRSEGVGVGFPHKVGFNDEHIIVLGELRSEQKAYFIVDIEEYKQKIGKTPGKQGRYGPYSKSEFQQHLMRIGQSDLCFTLFYEKSH